MPAMGAFRQAALTLALATIVSAQSPNFGPGNNPNFNIGGGGGSGSPSGNPDGTSGGSNGGNPGGNPTGAFEGENLSQFEKWPRILTAHAVLGSLAFVIFFPLGGILIRLFSFPKLWLVHGLVQLFAFVLFTACFALGIYMAESGGWLGQAHPVIGIVLFVLLAFQPILGVVHHVMFKKHSRRMVWSYGHIWLGRILITLGMINGGLGLRLATTLGLGTPNTGQIAAYSVVAGVMWLAYVGSAVWGEMRRTKAKKSLPTQKEATASDTDSAVGRGREFAGQHHPRGDKYA